MTVRRGLLRDYANQLSQIAVGWQLEVGDRPLLGTTGRAVVEIDLLAGAATVNGAPANPAIQDVLAAWLAEARVRDGVPDGSVERLTVRIDVEVTESWRERTAVRQVRRDARAELVTADRAYVGETRKREVWTRTGDRGAWLVRDLRPDGVEPGDPAS
jgi:hypothetical protein